MELTEIFARDTIVGKAAVFVALEAWDFASNLDEQLVLLGYTEGDVVAPVNQVVNKAILPEYTGSELAHEAQLVGPPSTQITMPMYAADPDLLEIVSPSGTRSGGFQRPLPVQERTLVIFPELLFVSGDAQQQTPGVLTPTGAGWTLDGAALTPTQLDLLNKGTRWYWRGFFHAPQKRWTFDRVGQLVEPVIFEAMYQSLAPNGHRAYTDGDPYDAGIDPLTGLIES